MKELFDFAVANPPTSVDEIKADRRAVRRAFRAAGVEQKLLVGIETRATKSGRRQTGTFRSNRDPRWNLVENDPQYGTEKDCRIIELRLVGFLLAFVNPPVVDEQTITLLVERYLGAEPEPGTYRDSLLLEPLDFEQFAEESANPRHGTSYFHIGHEDPTIQPKHMPENVSWRTHRSNLIQGDMTLREARIYIIRLIARYFELGELEIGD